MYIDRIYLHVGIYICVCVCICIWSCLIWRSEFGWVFGRLFKKHTSKRRRFVWCLHINHLVQGTESSIFCNFWGRDLSEQLWGCLVWGPDMNWQTWCPVRRSWRKILEGCLEPRLLFISFFFVKDFKIPSHISITGWWFGIFFIFPYIGNNHPSWLIFFRGVETTNQIKSPLNNHH